MKRVGSRIVAGFLSVVLILVLVFTGCLCATDTVKADEGSAAADESGDAAADEESTDAVWGQALVLYHAGEAAEEAGLAAASEDETYGTPDVTQSLTGAGFTVSQTWDVSAPDSAAGVELMSLDDESEGSGDAADTDAAYSALDTEPSAAAADLRVALVCDDTLSPAELVDKLEELDFVEAAQPNYIVSTSAVDADFDDTFYEAWQEQLTSAAVSDGTDTYNVGISTGAAAEADATAVAADTVEENVVAVIDTGVDFSNPDLADVAWENPGDIGLMGSAGSHGYDFIDNDDDPTPPETYEASHGTHCAGIIAASTNNGEGVASSAWHTKIMALRTSTSDGYALMSSIVSAYQYLVQAAAADVNIVAANNSWGGPIYSPVLDYLVTQAGKAGIISFFAAGNSGYDTEWNDASTSTCTLESPYAVLVASASDRGTLATYSNYNETQVDLATPGSLVLSTISTGAASDAFCATLSKQAGKDVEYYSDLSGLADDASLSWTLSAKSMSLETLSYEEIVLLTSGSADASAYMTLEKSAETVFGGEYGLSLCIDAKGLEEKTDREYASYILTMNWEIDNPFRQNTAVTDAADWTASMMIGQPATSSTTVSADAVVTFLSEDGQTQLGSTEVSASAYDIYAISQEANFTNIDTTSEKLQVQVTLELQDSDMDENANFVYADTLTCILSGLGVGTKDDYVPYGLMSGTSMATPAMVGAYAELAALYPDDTALELRGRLVGSTTPLATSKVAEGGHETATDGLFSFDVAINGDISANTWSAEANAEAGTVRLYGYALGDADVTVDDAAAVVTDRADDGSWMDVQVNADVLDGEAHRFDVTDGSTGKTHRASYTMPSVENGETDTLVYVCDLPADSAESGNAQLVSTPIGLVYASADGQWAYLCADPDADEVQWIELAACGTPWTADESAGVGRTNILYAYLDGVLYALAGNNSENEEGNTYSVYVSTLALADGTSAAWTPFACTTITDVPDKSGIYSVSAAVANGAVHFAVNYHTSNYDDAKVLLVSVSDDGISQRFIDPADILEDGSFATLLGGDVLSVLMLQQDEDAEEASYKAFVCTYSEADGSWSTCELSGWSDLVAMEETDLFRYPRAGTGSGEVFFGKNLVSDETAGDVFLLDPVSATWTIVGSFGLRDSTGLIVQSGAMFDGKLYIVAQDSQSTGTDEEGTASVCGALYTLPDEAAGTLTSSDVQIDAGAETGGTATVADWRGTGASNLGDTGASVRLGDTVTWTAVPDEGYAFAGWYNEDGELVSADAVYAQRITRVNGASSLTARFTLASAGAETTPEPGSSTQTGDENNGSNSANGSGNTGSAGSGNSSGSSGSTGSESSSGSSGSTGSGSSSGSTGTAKTGDSANIMLWCALAVLAAAIAQAAVFDKKRRQ